MFGDRILVLIPHPDDEVVGCLGAVLRAVARGSEVFGYYLTTGISPREVLWPWQRRSYPRRVERRRREARTVAQSIGIQPLRFHDHPSRTLKSHLGPLREDLLRILEELRIDTIWTPAYEGGHQDHDATNCLAATLTHRAEVWEFSEYHFHGRKVHTQQFIAPRPDDRVLTLTPAEREAKRRALAAYASEKGNLRPMNTRQESFRPLPSYDYSRPPHEGPLFYERFHWVPFRHPRVDFSTSRSLCRVFKAFLASVSSGPASSKPEAGHPGRIAP